MLSSKSHVGESLSIQCHLCSLTFANSHKLSGHLSRAHHVRHPARAYAGGNGICRVCLKCFHNRPRLIHHLRQCSKICLEHMVSTFPKFSLEMISSLDEEDRVSAACARAAGKSKLLAQVPVIRASGPLRPLIQQPCTPDGICLSVKKVQVSPSESE